MQWTKCSFRNAVPMLAEAFASSKSYDYLALVWREPGEYRVMQPWELKPLYASLRQDRLRIVLWLDRAEAGILLGPSVGHGR